MNKQLQSPDEKPEHSSSTLPPQKSGDGGIGLSGLMLLGLLVGVVVVGGYSWRRHQDDKSRATSALQKKKQVEENQERLAIQHDRYELEQLKKKRDKLYEDVKSVDKQLRGPPIDVQSLVCTGPPSEQFQQVIAESMKKIDEGKAQLMELTSDLARSEAALEGGREACLEHCRLLKEASEIPQHVIIVDSKELALQQQKIMEELESEERLPPLTSHPSQKEIQRIQLAINKRKTKIAELDSLSAKVEAPSPQQIIRRYIVDVKQQIGSFRLALAADLKNYRSNYEKAVKAERVDSKAKEKTLKAERDQLFIKLQQVGEQILKLQSAMQSKLSQ